MKYRITSRFKELESFRNHPHNGVDFKMNNGEPLQSIEDGIIRIHDFGNVNAGKTVIIECEDGKSFIYGHLSKFAVEDGQIISKGDLIGYSGNTGFSTGSHLHFGVKENGEFIDPNPWIDSIQNMDNLDKIKAVVENSPLPDVKFSTLEFLSNTTSNSLDGFLEMLKVNFIDMINLFDYSIFLQYFEYLIQFFLF